MFDQSAKVSLVVLKKLFLIFRKVFYLIWTHVMHGKVTKYGHEFRVCQGDVAVVPPQPPVIQVDVSPFFHLQDFVRIPL